MTESGELMKSSLAIACAGLLFAASPANAQSDPLGMIWGRDALTTCSHAEARQRRDATSALVCLSWINGAVQGASATVSSTGAKPDYCTPRVGGSNGQYAAVYLKFLRDNPAKRHLPAIYLFHEAMAEAFPCA